MSKEIAVPKSAVPALAYTPSFEVDAEDIQLSRIYTASPTSKAFQNSLVGLGDIYAAAGADDPNAELLYKHGEGDGVLVHILSMVKGKSLNEGGTFERWAYNDPTAPPEAWTTYDYTVVLPEVDDTLPYKLLLSRSGRGTAKRINTVLRRHNGPIFEVAFRLTSTIQQNDKGRWSVIQAKQVPASAEDVKLAEGLFVLTANAPQPFAESSEAPAI